jgi:DNA-binding LacI/PurR family transcriptional regulator
MPSEKEPVSAPLYQRLEATLRAKIRAGVLPPGSRLPGRRALAREYGVALPTIERAISVLVADGALWVDDRRGTFVADRGSSPARTEEPARVCACGERSAVPAFPASLPAPLTLGVITTLTGEDDLFITTVLSALERSFLREGGSLRCADRHPANRPPTPMAQVVAEMREAGASALALVDDGGVDDESVAALEASGLPFVVVSGEEIRRPVPAVCPDNYCGAYQAAGHLLDGGHREMLFLAPFTAPWVEARIAGARDAIRHAGLPPESLRVRPAERRPLEFAARMSCCDAWTESACRAARAAFCEGAIPTGVIAANDRAAFGVYRAAAEVDMTVGEDFALVAFDDHPKARFLGLTTLRPPLEAMGQEAGRMLLDALRGGEMMAQVRLRFHLIPRASTCSYRRSEG